VANLPATEEALVSGSVVVFEPSRRPWGSASVSGRCHCCCHCRFASPGWSVEAYGQELAANADSPLLDDPQMGGKRLRW